MEFQISVSTAGAFRRITLSLSEKPQPLEMSAIITPPSEREEIFLPSPEKILPNATYPQSGGRFVTQTGKGKYQLIFQPKEAGPHELKLVGRVSGKPFQQNFQIKF